LKSGSPKVAFPVCRQAGAGRAEGRSGGRNFCLLALPAEGGRKRWAGFNPQDPLNFAQKRLKFRPNSTAR